MHDAALALLTSLAILERQAQQLAPATSAAHHAELALAHLTASRSVHSRSEPRRMRSSGLVLPVIAEKLSSASAATRAVVPKSDSASARPVR